MTHLNWAGLILILIVSSGAWAGGLDPKQVVCSSDPSSDPKSAKKTPTALAHPPTYISSDQILASACPVDKGKGVCTQQVKCAIVTPDVFDGNESQRNSAFQNFMNINSEHSLERLIAISPKRDTRKLLKLDWNDAIVTCPANSSGGLWGIISPSCPAADQCKASVSVKGVPAKEAGLGTAGFDQSALDAIIQSQPPNSGSMPLTPSNSAQ